MKRNVYLRFNEAPPISLVKKMLNSYNPHIVEIFTIDKNTYRVVEGFYELENEVNYNDFVDLIELDGISGVKLFTSMPYTDQAFEALEKELLFALDIIKGKVFSINDLILYVFSLEQNMNVLALLKEYIETVALDEVETAKAFLKFNMNASVAAKKTFVHRNTFNYRLNKFINNTGINIKEFKGAASIFMILQLLDDYTSKVN